jgi:T4-like virus tail tube protein gp19
MATARTVSPDTFAVMLDGVSAGLVKSVVGGDVHADVIEEPGTPFVKKHIGPPRYEDITVQVGFQMSQQLYEWIAGSWAGAGTRRDGAIVTADLNLTARTERQFFHALLTETTIPALDAASKNPAYLTVKFAPESTKSVKASGTIAGGATKQKLFLPSNFRFELDGVDCKRVTKIDTFTVRQELRADEIGEVRRIAKQAARVEFPNLRVSIGDGPTVASWQSWFDDFVIKGNCDDSMEKSGAIVFLTPDLKSELARVVLHNVGICALRRPPRIAQSEAPRVVTVELYCERMEFRVTGLKPPATSLRREVVGVRG